MVVVMIDFVFPFLNLSLVLHDFHAIPVFRQAIDDKIMNPMQSQTL